MYDKQALVELVREKALKFGRFTLASGKEATYYLDGKQVTLDPAGARLVADGLLDMLTMRDRFGKLSGLKVVIVGDSWLADIEGAKRIGMQAILLTQYAPYEQPNQSVGDYQPDASISCLAELETLLLRGETR